MKLKMLDKVSCPTTSSQKNKHSTISITRKTGVCRFNIEACRQLEIASNGRKGIVFLMDENKPRDIYFSFSDAETAFKFRAVKTCKNGATYDIQNAFLVNTILDVLHVENFGTFDIDTNPVTQDGIKMFAIFTARPLKTK